MAAHIHLVGGEAYGATHAPGDPVSSRVPKKKLAEWLAAGVIAAVDEEGEDL